MRLRGVRQEEDHGQGGAYLERDREDGTKGRTSDKSRCSCKRKCKWAKNEAVAQSTRQGSRHSLWTVDCGRWTDGAETGGTVISGRQGRDQETTQTAAPVVIVSLQLSSLECLRTLHGPGGCNAMQVGLGTDDGRRKSQMHQMQQQEQLEQGDGAQID